MEKRLQFKHDSKIYGSFGEIKTKLTAAIFRASSEEDIVVPRLGEPVVFRYREGSNAGQTGAQGAVGSQGMPGTAGRVHLVLGIGMPRENDSNQEAEYTLLDLDSLNDGLVDIEGNREILEKIIEGLGFEEDGTFDTTYLKHKEYFEGEDETVVNYIEILHDKLKTSSGEVANLKLVYDDAEKEICLKFADGTLISKISATPFIKDGMIDKAVFVDTYEKAEIHDADDNHTAKLPYILIVWNTDGGKEKTRIPLESFYDVYVGHSGITIEGFDVSLNLDSQSEDFLSVSANGLKLSGVQDAIDEGRNTAIADSKAYTDEEISQLTNNINDVIEDLDNDITEMIIATNSAVSRNAAAILENREDIEELKDFAEYKVGEIQGEVIATIVVSNRDRIASLEERVSDAEDAIDDKVDKVEGKGLSTNDFTNEDKALLESISENAEENVIEVIKRNGTPLEVNSEKAVNIEVPFTSLSPNEKMLTLNAGVLESMFSVDYDSEAKKIFFYGKTNQKIGEINVADFLIDGMIRTVNVVTENGVKYLKFVFNTDAGGREIKIPLTDLVTEYTVSGGSEDYLVIDGFEIGVKVDAPDHGGLASASSVHDLDDKYSAITHTIEDKVGEGFTESGVAVSMTYKITEIENAMENFMDENRLVFDEDFKIAGIVGTLGTGKYKNGDVISAGTSVLEVLKDILQQRLLPEGVAPTAAVELVNAGEYEIGTKINPGYAIRFDKGKYTYADGTTGATGIELTSAVVTLRNNGGATSYALQNNTGSGIFEEVTVVDNMNLTLMANVEYASDYIPKDNLGTEVPSAKIPNSGISFIESVSAITGYRPVFYASLADGDIAGLAGAIQASASTVTITDAELQLFSKYDKNGIPRTIEITDGAEVVLILVPNSSNYAIEKIIDTDSGLDLKDVFITKQTSIRTYSGDVSGVGYTAYIFDPGTQISENVYKIISRVIA